ncbi:hypothetical protein EX30DRAFT_337476 [Ascodesmis nigricans]|uniref:BTB domain-containing protein n=1 Tax=Ascodesmis nigricans TaxID=341454 RepID=A0A4S2N791_9PEZI|nr:hypothetical protein EX30DRAFT_337476 [Ascodesmis nigricans]
MSFSRSSPNSTVRSATPKDLLATVTFLRENVSTLHDVIFENPKTGEVIETYSLFFPPDSFNGCSVVQDSNRRIFRTNDVKLMDSRRSDRLFQHYGKGDYHLIISGHRIPVHKVLLYQIPYFRGVFNPNFASAAADRSELPSDVFTKESADEIVRFLYYPILDEREDLNLILDIILATDYLQFDTLETLLMQVVNFRLKDNGDCAPQILAGLYEREIHGRFRNIVESAEYELARRPKTWKKSVVEMPDDMLKSLVKRTIKIVIFSRDAMHLWLDVSQLKGKVERSLSRMKDRWQSMVFEPLLRHAAQQTAKCIQNGIAVTEWCNDSVQRRDIGELLVEAVRVGMTEDNCLAMWAAVVNIEPHMQRAGQEVRKELIKWFKRNWLGLAMKGKFKGMDQKDLALLSKSLSIPTCDLVD